MCVRVRHSVVFRGQRPSKCSLQSTVESCSLAKYHSKLSSSIMADNANKRNIPIKLGDFSVIDTEFSSIRERFDSEMKKMEEEMARFRSDLMHREPNFFETTSRLVPGTGRTGGTPCVCVGGGGGWAINGGSAPSEWRPGLLQRGRKV